MHVLTTAPRPFPTGGPPLLRTFGGATRPRPAHVAAPAPAHRDHQDEARRQAWLSAGGRRRSRPAQWRAHHVHSIGSQPAQWHRGACRDVGARATLAQHASAHHGASPFSTGASRDVGAAAAVGRTRRAVDVLRRPELRAGRAAALDEPRRGGSDLVDQIAPSAGRSRRD